MNIVLLDLLPLVWGALISLCAVCQVLSLSDFGYLTAPSALALSLSILGAMPRYQVAVFFITASFPFLKRTLRAAKYKKKGSRKSATVTTNA